jgi:DMSO/TMAO reductase YedYZ molybdopterin-dependent catalytic subunit
MALSFFERNRKHVAELGYDPDRLPPGQYLTDRFPVLDVEGPTMYAPGQWTLRVLGEVERPFELNLDQLKALAPTELKTDIHCVTKWSKFDTHWKGVRVADLAEMAGMTSRATHLIGHAESGYTANVPLEDALRPNSIVAYEYEGGEIDPVHGGPVRLVIPHLYFWKSVKWVRAVEFRNGDNPGFWERNGYHNYGDPFREQRYWER